MPKKVLALVEGPTEEWFVKNKLGIYLAEKDINIIPTKTTKKKKPVIKDDRGGVVSYEKVKRDILNLLGDTSAGIVTTMIDYYGLPSTFPGYSSIPDGDCFAKVNHLEEEFKNDMNSPGDKFIPYLQLHEFEALIFASADKISVAFPEYKNSGGIDRVNDINNSFRSPEEINNSSNTAPSKRLKNIFAKYNKISSTPLILDDVNIDDLRDKCSHFNDWLTKLETKVNT